MSTANTSPFDTSMKWRQMGFMKKLVFMGKLVITLATFGFVFPNLMD